MEQFNLDKWLQDKSRKVVTRDGRHVRILCIDCGVRKSQPILTEITCSKGAKVLEFYNLDGTKEDKNLSLFFADEEDKLTEFEKELDVFAHNSKLEASNPNYYDWLLKSTALKLLDLAKKELIPIQDTIAYQEGVKEGRRLERQDIDKELDEAYKSRDGVVYLEGYDKGYEDALKDLPKWKKMPNGIQGNGDFNPTYLVRVSNGHYFTTPCLSWDKDSMYIKLSELENLPKEE